MEEGGDGSSAEGKFGKEGVVDHFVCAHILVPLLLQKHPPTLLRLLPLPRKSLRRWWLSKRNLPRLYRRFRRLWPLSKLIPCMTYRLAIFCLTSSIHCSSILPLRSRFRKLLYEDFQEKVGSLGLSVCSFIPWIFINFNFTILLFYYFQFLYPHH